MRILCFRYNRLSHALALVALLAVPTSPRAAGASGHLAGIGCLIYTVFWMIPSTAVDVGFAGYDIHQAVQGGAPSRGAAIGEVAVMSIKLIVALGIGGTFVRTIADDRGRSDLDGRCVATGAAVMAGFSASLLGHGIWTLTQPQPVSSLSSTLWGPREAPHSSPSEVNPALMIGVTVRHRF